jgi:ectoine hydroxylase-related dioxygenase (phytanoyl-CoA dioxygenase family)
MAMSDAPTLREVDRHDVAVVPRVLEHLADDGGVIVREMISAETLRELNADLDAVVESTRPGTRHPGEDTQRFWGAQTKRFTRLAWRSRTFTSEVLCHPVLLAVADELLRPHAADYWMNTGQMMVVGPSSKAQYLHRDADNWPAMNRPGGFEVTVSCMLALTDFTADAGATRVVPTSQAWDDYQRRAAPAEVTQAVMPAGSAMVYTGRVLHGAGANVTAGVWRRGLHISYVLGWLTPEEAGPLGVPEETVRGLPERAQRLLGWRSYDPGDDAARLWTVDYEDVPVGLGW